MNRYNVVSAIEQFVWGILSDVHTSMPGEVLKYDFSRQCAEIKPLLKRRFSDNTQQEYKPIVDVPVLFLQCGNGGIHFPVKPGDFALLLFVERSMDNWLYSGKVSDTLHRKFDITDAVAIMGIMPFTNTSLAENNDDVFITFNNQKIVIRKNGDIEVGGASLQKLLTQAAATLYNSHTHNVTVDPSTHIGTTLPPGQQMTTLHQTTKTRAQ